jgi:hypothetical protein
MVSSAGGWNPSLPAGGESLGPGDGDGLAVGNSVAWKCGNFWSNRKSSFTCPCKTIEEEEESHLRRRRRGISLKKKKKWNLT